MNTQPLQSKSRVFAAPLVAAVLAIAVPFVLAQQKTAGSGTEGGDRITVNLSDPSRPGTVKASLVFGSILVKGYDGKEILVEAHAREESPRHRKLRDQPEADVPQDN